MALHFDEVNDNITVSDNTALNLPSGDWFIGGWVKLDDNTGSANQYLFQWGVGGSPHILCFIGEDSRSAPLQGEVAVQFVDDSSNDSGFVSTDDNQPFTSNTSWTHVGVGRSGNDLNILINGTVQGTVDLSSIATFVGLNASGTWYWGDPGSGSSLLGGDLAEWAKWDRYPNAGEIAALVDGFSPLFLKDGASFYFPFVRAAQEFINNLSHTHNGVIAAVHPRTIYPYRHSEITSFINAVDVNDLSFGLMITEAVQIPFTGKWSLDNLESRTDYGFPTVWVEVDGNTLPTGAFTTGDFYERRITELPRIEEIELDSRFGVSGFQRVSLRVDNSDGLLSTANIENAFVRIFFVDDAGSAYKEFKGKIVDWTLSHECILNVEDIDAIAITQDLPLRTLNDLVEAEKIADGTFANFVIANDLGKPVPIIFGRAVKVPLLYVKANEAAREYDYIIGEGEGLSAGNFTDVFTVYRQDQALDDISGDVAAATSTTLTLEAADKRPDSWYKFWWVEITLGPGAGEIFDVTAYDSATNKITINGTWLITPTTSSDYRLREWRFYDGSQANPYDGYAFIRFKKRMGVSGRTDPIFADVNGFATEANPVRAIQSTLNNSAWGLNLGIDTTSFNTAAALSEITAISSEGAVINTTSALEVLRELLGFRDMVLTKDDNIQISVDQTKSSLHSFGLGDATGWNNILNRSPEILHIHPNEKVKNLKVRYRKNYKENDTYLHELERASSANGVDKTVNLPFIYAHDSADRWLDYKRKRFAAAVKRMNIEVGQDGKNANRGERVTITVPSIGLDSQAWEITGANVTAAGNNSLSLVPYSATPYTYVAITSEGGTLPVDESFDITPDYAQTIPDPVTNLVVSMNMNNFGSVDSYPFALLTWDAPEDNFGGAVVSVKLNSDPDTSYRALGTYDTSARIEGLTPGQLVDFKVESLNVTGEHKGLAVLSTSNLVGGDSTPPSAPTGLTGSSKFGDLIWTWNHTASADRWYEEIEVYTASSGGSPIDVKRVYRGDEPTHTFKAQTGDLTTSLTRWAQVRAVDYSGNASPYTSRISASTGDVQRLDAKNLDFNQQYTGGSDSAISITGGFVTIASASGTFVSGQTAFIHASFLVERTTSTFGDLIWRIKRGSTILKQIGNNADWIGVGEGVTQSYSVEDTPGSGSITYSIEATMGGGQASLRRIIANLYKR